MAPVAGSPSQLIAREIRAELARQQISNRRLAAALGVSGMWVNRRISACETELTVEDTERIAAALGVSLRQLLNPWLDHKASPTRPVIDAYAGEDIAHSDDKVVSLFQHLGDGPGVLRRTRTAAA